YSAVYYSAYDDTPATQLSTLSLHDALPICYGPAARATCAARSRRSAEGRRGPAGHAAGLSVPRAGAIPPWRRSPRDFFRWRAALDRKSTRLNSSHVKISYAVFCLKKKKINK